VGIVRDAAHHQKTFAVDVRAHASLAAAGLEVVGDTRFSGGSVLAYFSISMPRFVTVVAPRVRLRYATTGHPRRPGGSLAADHARLTGKY
jgi:hypothetical protein